MDILLKIIIWFGDKLAQHASTRYHFIAWNTLYRGAMHAIPHFHMWECGSACMTCRYNPHIRKKKNPCQIISYPKCKYPLPFVSSIQYFNNLPWFAAILQCSSQSVNCSFYLRLSKVCHQHMVVFTLHPLNTFPVLSFEVVTIWESLAYVVGTGTFDRRESEGKHQGRSY